VPDVKGILLTQCYETLFSTFFDWIETILRRPRTNRTLKAATSSVKPARDNGMLDKQFERDDLEGVLVRGFENNRTTRTGLLNLQPPRSADAPPVAGFEAREAVLGHRSDEIVPKSPRGFEEGLVDDATDSVNATVVGAGVAATVAIEAGHWLAAADFERLSEDISRGGLDRFGCRHGELSVFQLAVLSCWLFVGGLLIVEF
jgi:hypothetical protein